jgi:methylase of polypeptide subunit release factors
MVEVGFDQGRAVKILMQAAGLERVDVVQDLTGTDRVVKGQLPPLLL